MDYGAADQALLAQIASGDRAALEALYRRHSGWITARLQHRCADIELVDTAVQDTFLAAWRGAKRYSGRGDVGAWLWGIAIRKLIDQLRARRPTPIAPELVNTSITARRVLRRGALGIGGVRLGRSRVRSPRTRSASGVAGDCDRRVDHEGGGPPAGRAARNSEDATDAGPSATARGPGIGRRRNGRDIWMGDSDAAATRRELARDRRRARRAREKQARARAADAADARAHRAHVGRDAGAAPRVVRGHRRGVVVRARRGRHVETGREPADVARPRADGAGRRCHVGLWPRVGPCPRGDRSRRR